MVGRREHGAWMRGEGGGSEEQGGARRAYVGRRGEEEEGNAEHFREE